MLKKEKYLRTVRREYKPLQYNIIFNGYAEPTHFKRVLDVDVSFQNMVVVDYVAYYEIKSIEETGRIALNKWEDPQQFEKAKDTFFRLEQYLINTSLESDLKNFFDAFEAYMPALAIIFSVDKPVYTKIKQLLNEKVGEEEADEILDELNVPLKDNYYKEEEYELINASDLEGHVKKYEWLNSRYGSRNPYTIDQARKNLAAIDKNKFLKKYKEEKEHVKIVIKRAKEILGLDAYIVDIMQFIIYYRTQRTDVMNRSLYQIIPAIEKRAEDLNISYDEALFCMREELLSGEIPSTDIVSKRVEKFAVVSEDGKISCLIGEQFIKIYEYFEEDLGEVAEIKGQIACKGNVKGKVRLINNIKDFSKVSEGDILVTSMTTPEMMPIMKKADAFVTDEGGITCHAAIISREMKKPCIIGTKIATQVLKDGDIAEVDADNGVVRILDK